MSSISEKILKLIAKADGTENEHEADAFMKKAHELLQEHGLSLMDLGKLGDDPVGVDVDAVVTRKQRWRFDVANALAAYFGVDFVYHKRGTEGRFTVSGRESARVTFALMLPFVFRQVQKLARESYNQGRYHSASVGARRIAAATALRIWRMVPETQKNHGTGPNALVPVDLNKQALEDMFDNVKQAKKQKLVMDEHAREQAKKISLYRQTGASEGAKQLT